MSGYPSCEIASRAEVGPVRWDRRDELGQLGEHLNEVHEQINELFGQLESQKSELEKIALHDTLTGLPNRDLFRELTHAAVAAAARDGRRLALLAIDVDRFKAVNDTLGHAAGDALLVTLAGRLRSTVRASDVVCRHSGDEFIVPLHDGSQWDEVAATVDRVLKDMEQPLVIDGREVAVSASIGVTLCPDDATDPETLVRHADTAMYAAKNLGQARVSFFRAEFNTQLQATVQLARALGIRVVSEGMETSAQRVFLHRMGCGNLQGHLINRPQPAEGFERFARYNSAVINQMIHEEAGAGV